MYTMFELGNLMNEFIIQETKYQGVFWLESSRYSTTWHELVNSILKPGRTNKK